jgi:CDP-paratose 2-epimerase
VLEAVRRWAPSASFAFLSTNKVYGDHPNALPLEEGERRLDLPPSHPYHRGIDTSMSIDRAIHSPFGVSKAAADLMVQEYGRYYGLPTVCFRCGCLSGPRHAGAQLHGFLSYLMRCAVTGQPYTIFGYEGKQVRDNLHSRDVVRAVLAFHRTPRAGAVYNLGGGRASHCSLLEAMDIAEEITDRPMRHAFDPEARVGDHRWWVSNLDAFRADYPEWDVSVDVRGIMQEIHDANAERWVAVPHAAETPHAAPMLLEAMRNPAKTDAADG